MIESFQIKRFRLPVVLLAVCFGYLLLTGCEKETDAHNFNSHRRSEIIVSGTPIPVRATKENKGRRCEDGKNFDMPEPQEDTPEYYRCKNLQKKLNQAAWDGDVEAIRKALEDGASVRAGYYQEGTPLSGAITKGHMAAVKLLVENGAEVNQEYIFGDTALKKAAFYNFPDIAKFLIENGADICSNLPDDVNKKLTAFDIAKQEGHGEMILLLESAGAENCP